MSWLIDRQELEEFAKLYDKSIVLYTKDNWFCETLSWLVFIFTLGRISREYFMTHVANGIANLHFYPVEWSTEEVLKVLPHEARHTYQFRILGFGIHPLVGFPLACIVYLLFPLPFLFALGRFYMELDADRKMYYYMLSKDGDSRHQINQVRYHALHKATKVSGALYAWAVPHKLAYWWYTKTVDKAITDIYGK